MCCWRQTMKAKSKLPKKQLRLTFRDWKKHFKILSIICAVVAIPTAILNVATAGDSATQAYLSLATMIMNIVVIWAIIRLKSGHKVSVKEAYFEGSSSLVRFFLVASVLALQFI